MEGEIPSYKHNKLLIMNNMDSLKNKLFFVSFGLGLASTVAIFNPNASIKPFGNFGVGLAVGGVVLGEVITGQAVSVGRKNKEEYEKELNAKITQITSLQTTVDELVKKSSHTASTDLNQKNLEIAELTTQKNLEIAELKMLVERLNSSLTNTVEVRQLLESTLISTQESLKLRESELTICRENLADIGRFTNAEAYNIVKHTYERSVKKVESLLDALIRNHPQVAEILKDILIELDSLKNRFLNKLAGYEQLKSFDELLDVGMTLQEEIIDKCTSFKVKGQTVVIKYLQDYVTESIPFTDFETHIRDLSEKAGEQIAQTRLEGERNERAIAQEWVTSNQVTIDRYDSEFSEAITHAKYSISRMQAMEETIQSLNERIKELEKPQEWRSNVLDAQKVGNLIIRFYWQQGIRLDRAFIQNDPYEPVLYFAVNRMDDIIKIEELNKFSEAVQQHVDLLIEAPRFSYNGDYGLVQTKIKLAHKPKPTKEDLVVKIPECKTLVSKAKRGFLITGQPGAGKTSSMKAISQWLGNDQTMRLALNPHDDESSSFVDAGFVEVNDLEDIYAAIRELDTELKLRGKDKSRRQTLIIAVDELGRILKDAPKDLDVMEVFRQAAVEGRKFNVIILLGNHSQTTTAIEMDSQFRDSFYQLFLVGGATNKVNAPNAPALKQNEIDWINSASYPVLAIVNGRGSACQHPTHYGYKEYQDSGNPPMGLIEIEAITVSIGNQLYTPSMRIQPALLTEADKLLIAQHKALVNLKTTAGTSVLIEKVKGVKASKSEDYKQLKEAVLDYLKELA